jgi:hypothetical protein
MGKQVARPSAGADTSRHLRWEVFESRINKGPPSYVPIDGSPRITVFIDPHGARIGATFFGGVPSILASPLAEISIQGIGVHPHEAIEVSTTNRGLYRDFYTFCCAAADRIQLDRQSVTDALAETLRSWSALTRRKSLLSTEQQTGLFGELTMLARAAKRTGWVTAVNAWQGPAGQEHDFTFLRADAEVKTTLSERRLHQIGSLTQMQPKPDRQLVVVSVQLTPSSGSSGQTLSQLVSRSVLSATSESRAAADGIRDRLARLGWSDDDAPQYTTSLQLRAKMAAITVDANFPAIVPHSLVNIGPKVLARITGISYTVMLDGLGTLDGSRQFDRLLFPS